jgi:hypothetical protein
LLLLCVVIFSGRSFSQSTTGGMETSTPCVAIIEDGQFLFYYPPRCELNSNTSTAGGSSGATASSASSAGTSSSTAVTSGSDTGSTAISTSGTTLSTTSGNGSGGSGFTTTGGTGASGGNGGNPDEDEEEESPPQTPTLGLQSSDLGPGRVLSWTSEDIQFQLGFSAQSNVTINQVEKLEFQIESQYGNSARTVVCPWVAWSATADGDVNHDIKRSIRLDSTKFKDGTFLFFKAKARIKWAATTPNGVTPTQTSDINSMEQGAPVCNGTVMFSTLNALSPFANMYGGVNFSSHTNSVCNAVFDILKADNFHRPQFNPSYQMKRNNYTEGGNQYEGISTKLASSRNSSVFTITHGASNGLWDSEVPAVSCPEDNHRSYLRFKRDNFMYVTSTPPAQDIFEPGTAEAIESYTGKRDYRDPLCGGIFYCCELNRTNDLLDKLVRTTKAASGNLPALSPAVNRCVLGFPEVVWVYVVLGDQPVPSSFPPGHPYTLKHHAERLMNELVTNKASAGEARVAANNAFKTVRGQSEPLPAFVHQNKNWYASALTSLSAMNMELKGDPQTLWKGLYTNDIPASQQRIVNAPTDEWLFIYGGRK